MMGLRIFTNLGLARHNHRERRDWIRWVYESQDLTPPRYFPEQEIKAAVRHYAEAGLGEPATFREAINKHVYEGRAIAFEFPAQ